VGTVEESLDTIKSVFDNQSGPGLDIVCLNAGAAIYVAGLADSHQKGVQMAQQVIAEGKAKATLQKLVDASNT
jgi:anthranilate phosphoribosyltransferase